MYHFIHNLLFVFLLFTDDGKLMLGMAGTQQLEARTLNVFYVGIVLNQTADFFASCAPSFALPLQAKVII